MDNHELFKTYFTLNNNEISIAVINTIDDKIVFFKKTYLSSKQNELISEEIEYFFLEKINEIEKKTKTFVKNIFLIIKDKNIFPINLSLKKKFDNQIISDDEIKRLLTNGLQLIYEHYQDHLIIHFLINKFNIDGQTCFSIKNKNINDYLCLDLIFICINKDLIKQFKKLFQKKEIHLKKIFSEDYLKQYKNGDDNIIKTVIKIENGANNLEVKLVPKIHRKKGFFENFFLSF